MRVKGNRECARIKGVENLWWRLPDTYFNVVA